MATRIGLRALLLLPGALLVWLSFQGGGFFPREPAIVAIVVLQFLIVYATQSRNAFGALSWPAIGAIVSISAYALWILLSQAWSDAPSRSLIEFDRALLYALVVLLFALAGGTADRLRWAVRGVALAITFVATISLITRVAPDLYPTDPGIANNRLSYPVSYWNALGIQAAMGAILCLHLSSSRNEAIPVRVLAAMALPVLGCTVFFTFSRGGIAAGIVGIAVYVLVGRPRALLSGALAAVPAVIAVKNAYGADLLVSSQPTTPAAVAQGHDLAVVVILCVLAAGAIRLALALLADRRLPVTGYLPRTPRRVVMVAVAVVTAGALIAPFATGVAGTQYDRFLHGASSGSTSADFRQRLTTPYSRGRVQQFQVALDGWREQRFHGFGAQMYPLVWERLRPQVFQVRDAHSLYLETLAELGIVGLLLIVAAILALAGTLAFRARGPDRAVYAAALAAFVAWALHAGVDWDWEMPAITLPAFALAAVGVGNRTGRLQLRAPGPNTQMAIALACLAALVTPVCVAISQTRLEPAASEFRAGDCTAAMSDAERSLSWMATRPEAYQILGFCNLRRGFAAEALQAMEKARSYDPFSWEGDVTLALARAGVGEDPRALLRRARRRNPGDKTVQLVERTFATSPSSSWPGRAVPLLDALMNNNTLTISR